MVDFFKKLFKLNKNQIDEDGGIRTIYANDIERNRQYPSNRISNTKYTVLTFIPKNLIEQFGRAMNIYFLMIGVLQLFPSITPVDPISTWGALFFIFAISATKEAFDDYNRSKRDKKANSRIYTVLRNNEKQQIESQYILVGDIVYLTENEEIPCDLMVLSTSDKTTNSLYVQTSNLDGETDLKIKYSIKETSNMDLTQLKSFQGVLECPVPSAVINKFDSRLSMRANRKVNTFSHSDWLPVDSSNLVLQATHLKNTDYIYGLVVYTGNETKLGKNKMEVPTKWTKLDKQINKTTICIFCIQLTLVLIFGCIGDYFRISNGPSQWYLDYQVDNSWPSKIIIIPLRFLLLNSMMIPISLKVTIDVIKYVYALFINWDLKMYHSETDCPATANSTALSEDLGQVEYIFTDKTGTLTENVMLFSKCSINGKIYHRDSNQQDDGNDNEIQSQQQQQQQQQQVVQQQDNNSIIQRDLTNNDSTSSNSSSTSSSGSRSYNNSPSSTLLKPISSGISMDESEQYLELKREMRLGDENVVEFFRSLSLCHTIVPMPTIDEITGANSIHYKSSSPDEEALVNASKIIGAKFTSKTPTTLSTEVNGQLEQYQLLHTFEFTSDRKRMSVVIRDNQTSQIKIICKGADEVMFKLLSSSSSSSSSSNNSNNNNNSNNGNNNNNNLLNTYSKQIDEFASKGLRTLCLAQRIILKEDYERWFTSHFQKATTAIQDRSLLLGEAYNFLERDLELLGITAIEDKLQEDVPRTINVLRQAQIKIWMLTGDKYSTAIQIANSCNLINSSGGGGGSGGLSSSMSSSMSSSSSSSSSSLQNNLFTIGKGINDHSNSGALADIGTMDVQTSVEGLLKHVSDLTVTQQLNSSIIVEGHVLALVLVFAANDFLKLTQMVGSLICCRVTPSQKAQVVKMIKDTGRITLAIGDGGNDVSMIQEANIGVGISGREGLQASRAADYSLARFKYLQELILVHGRYSYLRTSFAAGYSFYKSMFICFIQILFQLFSGFGGTSFFNTFSLTSYNILFTGLPVVGFIFDKDLPEAIIRRNPYLYSIGQDSTAYNLRTISQWIIRALFQSIFVFTFTLAPYVFSDNSGASIDYNSISMISFTAIIFIQSFTLFFESHTITWINQILIWGTIPIYFACIAVLNAIPSFDTYTVITYLFESGSVWFSMIIMILISIAPVVSIQYLFQIYKPNINEIIHQIRNSQSKNYKQLNDSIRGKNIDYDDDYDESISNNYNSTPSSQNNNNNSNKCSNNNNNNNSSNSNSNSNRGGSNVSRESTFKYQLRSRNQNNNKQQSYSNSSSKPLSSSSKKVVDLIIGRKEDEEMENKKLYDLRTPLKKSKSILVQNNNNNNQRIRGDSINNSDSNHNNNNNNNMNSTIINNNNSIILNNNNNNNNNSNIDSEYKPLLG